MTEHEDQHRGESASHPDDLAIRESWLKATTTPPEAMRIVGSPPKPAAPPPSPPPTSENKEKS